MSGRHLLFAIATSLVPTTAALGQDARASEVVWSGRLTSATTLEIRNLNGAITVRRTEGDRAEVRAEKHSRSRDAADIRFDISERDGVVRICSVFDRSSACDDRRTGNTGSMSVSYSVSLPANISVTLVTGNGAISLDRGGAVVEARTGNGNVEIGETTGRVSIASGNGDLGVRRAGGPVSAHTGNGQIDVVTATGPVSARTGNGAIDVRMDAISGSDDMSFTSGSGTISVTLPSSFNGEFEATTGNGALRSDFPIQMTGRLDSRRVRGRIGQGGPTITMRTGNGRLELLSRS